MKNKYLSTLFVLVLLIQACRTDSAQDQEVPLFTELDSTQTGVGFVNTVKPTANLNLMDYLYFYNGGGVSVGDLNNDGLPDVYFVSNQGKNKLYVNKGNFQFEDISARAGVEGFADWQTGVTMADVNGDGLLDIYVCAVGNYRGLEGANELYINNGDLTFTEKAADYGLDFTGFSTQAVFFDYDKDGDLDCYLLNHAIHTSRSYDRVSTRHLRHNESGDYLYQSQLSDQGNPSKAVKFKDVSEKAGIYGPAMGYGLGVAVADLNNDGWDDLYVSNDFHEDDYCYLNNGDGTFSEKGKSLFRYMSRFSMGNDVADVNNDGYPDIVTLDMYPEDEQVEKTSLGEDPIDIYQYKLSFGYMPQFSRNCLQINMSGQKFMDVAALAGVAATDWSWSPLLADYDNDGVKDLFVSNGIAHRPNNLDYVKFAADDSLRYAMETSSTLDEKALGLMPEGRVHNFMYRGSTQLRFEDKSLSWGFARPTLSHGAAYADLDGDGDLDLITNNLNEPASLYQNQARSSGSNHYLRVALTKYPQNTFALGAKVVLLHQGTLQVQQLMLTRGFGSSSEPVLHFGLGEATSVDSLLVVWPNQQAQWLTNVRADQKLTIAYQPAAKVEPAWLVRAPDARLFEDATEQWKVPYRHQENTYYDNYRESLMPFLLSTEGPKLAVADVNGDGLDDFYVGGAKWQAGSLFLQQPSGRFVPSLQPDFGRDSTHEDVDAVFFDANGDGHPDLYVVSGGNEFYDQMPALLDRLYLNDGQGHFRREASALPAMYENKSCVRPVDIDQDGDLDLFVGGRVVGYQYGAAPRSYLLINDGKGHFTDQTTQRAPGLERVGLVTDALWADMDGDKAPDLVVVGDWMPVRVFLNKKGKLEASSTFTTPTGLWQCVAAADFDQDGDLDLVVGNLGENTKFRRKPDSQLRMWVKDLDQNGSLDHLLAYSVGEAWYPVAFKDELGKQVPSIINKRFTDYKTYAGKTMEELFKKEELRDATLLQAETFASVYLENKGGSFEVHALPVEAQTSKVFSWAVTDLNGDGLPDLLGGGNYHGVSMYQGRYDASYGLVLLNGGKAGRFRALSPVDTGFLLEGEIRDLRLIQVKGEPYWLVARNKAPLLVLKPRGTSTPARVTGR
ncbi:hypothetical protein HNQ92_003589 [Rhabdobacter roseus]|uniref:ASPIC/UnbV domain-containing protein n=1 Tax=Rhabdobacter roseus TaxID=1655419 RepID=A0A840TV27_9BACT|nr:VCBS repeat-containing protein [Rhabdobacter roseus]MBB5285432.1 hypothetical protein [Rhabdobacter roseus]